MDRTCVLDVGNCDPDHGAMRAMLTTSFDVEVDRVMFVDEALVALAKRAYRLVLVNRRIFADDSDGSELIRRMKSSPALRDVPIMLVSNHADAQAAAKAAGAEPGFGKAALSEAATRELLARYLPPRAARATRSPPADSTDGVAPVAGSD
ncbi:MAG: hypothetical protein CHACPFDD_02415 [Phycisphaerae bacterium]|nr:hypothetical protein [Phycisphaerae bacterium]